MSDARNSGGVTRRGFLLGTGAGVALGGSLALIGRHGLPLSGAAPVTTRGTAFPDKQTAMAMPGLFAGRVIEVRHRGAVSDDYTIDPRAVQKMVARGICGLTGADHPIEGWRRFFEPGDVVGIKINPVGRPPSGKKKRDVVAAISNPEVILEIVNGLKNAGVRARDIIVIERYADEFRDTSSYVNLLRSRPFDGVRWYASSSGYDNDQLEIDGLARGRRKESDPHVVGYDPDVFVTMGFCQPEHDPKDDRRFRSHLSLIVTRMVNKLINVPVLKDHRSSGVTLCLKNMSHGLNNNVARSHIEYNFKSNMGTFNGSKSNPNQCNTFIPLAASQKPLREKMVLHVLDGLIGVYEGGPAVKNHPTWGTWPRQSLFFGTDPVAIDHVGWDIIDRKRAEEGWLPVAQMTNFPQRTPPEMLSAHLSGLSAQGLPDMLALQAAGQIVRPPVNPGELDRRQPEHIFLASTEGLGVFDARHIEHRTIQL